MWIKDWTDRAACKDLDPDELFVQGAAQNRRKQICRGCSVRTECLADALDNRIEFGVWGGMTERERRALLRRRPEVTSWRELLDNARSRYERGEKPSQTTPSSKPQRPGRIPRTAEVLILLEDIADPDGVVDNGSIRRLPQVAANHPDLGPTKAPIVDGIKALTAAGDRPPMVTRGGSPGSHVRVKLIRATW